MNIHHISLERNHWERVSLIERIWEVILIVFFILQNVEVLWAQSKLDINPPSTVNALWQIREHFVYNVRYGCFKLGTVTVEILPDSLYEGHECRHVRAVIASNPKLIFVGKIEQAFSSLMMKNDTIPYDVLFWEDDITKHRMKTKVYKLDYKKRKVYTYVKGVPGDTLLLDEPAVCGPAYFFYTRVFAGTNAHIKVPLYIDEEKNYITFNNTQKTEDIKCRAFPNGHVVSYVSSGDAHFRGPFGFNGHYRAWYAVGALKIPVQAYLKVWLGNVKIRLVEYSIKEK